jgi:hypothetical protein
MDCSERMAAVDGRLTGASLLLAPPGALVMNLQ